MLIGVIKEIPEELKTKPYLKDFENVIWSVEPET